MRKMMAFLLVTLLVCGLFAGCRRSVPEQTQPSTSMITIPTVTQTQPSQTAQTSTPTGGQETASRSVRILDGIWQKYDSDQKFSAYGGAVENSVSDGAGALDMANTEELTARYLLPEDQLGNVTEGASLVHLMNSNIFTGVVLRVSDKSTMKELAKQWRTAIQGNRWICGQPDKLVMMDVDGEHILMAFGSAEILSVFQEKAVEAYPDGVILYQEAIVS